MKLKPREEKLMHRHINMTVETPANVYFSHSNLCINWTNTLQPAQYISNHNSAYCCLSRSTNISVQDKTEFFIIFYYFLLFFCEFTKRTPEGFEKGCESAK